MYEVRVKTAFSASHQLRLYDGQLEPMHGHDWEVEAVYRGPVLDPMGVLVDFTRVKQALAEITGQLEHRHLNDLPAWSKENPSAESVARWIHERLVEAMPPWRPSGVSVKEAPGCTAVYWAAD